MSLVMFVWRCVQQRSLGTTPQGGVNHVSATSKALEISYTMFIYTCSWCKVGARVCKFFFFF